ncbi:MAG: MATE family efflux transporter [Clostridia bacterium]|nr:MATE family efflux transporter [Clostridia bacterium]
MDLTEGNIFQQLMIFVVPLLLANLVQQLYNTVDMVVIGQYVGSAGATGVSTGGEVAAMITFIATALGSAGQIYVAQLSGAKDHAAISETIMTSLVFSIGFSLAMTALCVIFCDPMLRWLNCPAEAFGQAHDYMMIVSCGLPFVFGYNMVCGVLRGMGEAKRPLLFITVAALSNIVMDLLLVAVIPMEAAGTAIATVAAELASFIAAFIYMYKRREQFGFELKLSYFKMDKTSVGIILKLGIPQAIRTILVRFSMIWVNANINSYGAVASGTNGIGNKLQKFLEIFSQSMSQASGAMIGQNLGAKKHDRAKKTVYIAMVASLIVALIIVGIVLLWPHALFGIFTNDADVLAMGVDYLNIMIVHFLVSAVISAYQSMVIGAGNAPLNFAIGILDGVICKIGFSLIFVNMMGMGVYGYFWGTALSRVLPMCICMIYFYSGRWKKAQLLKDKK